MSGVQQCPVCGTRVVPSAEDACPACRGYNFATGARDEQVAAARKLAARDRALRPGAVLHRRLLVLFGVQLGLAGFFEVASRVPDNVHRSVDPTLVVLFVMLFVYARMVGTTYRLGSWLGMNGIAWAGGLLLPALNLLVFIAFLRRSVTFFNSQGVRAGVLGPNYADVRRVDERRGAA